MTVLAREFERLDTEFVWSTGELAPQARQVAGHGITQDQQASLTDKEIAERLGIVLTPGIAVDPDAIERGGRPVMSVAASGAYGGHPILSGMRVNTLFPFARSVSESLVTSSPSR